MLLPKYIVKKARTLNITSKKELSNMIDMAAPITHHLGNRRYEKFIFMIQDGIVKDINLDIPSEEQELCLDCHNDGDFCLTCGTNT